MYNTLYDGVNYNMDYKLSLLLKADAVTHSINDHMCNTSNMHTHMHVHTHYMIAISNTDSFN